MVIKIAVGAGHGVHTPGKRTPDDEREWTFNNKVVSAFIDEIKTYDGVEVMRLDDPTGQTDISLEYRVGRANAWGADIYISCHHNALKGVWFNGGGIETFIYYRSPKSRKLARLVHPKVLKAMGLGDRGIKEGNLYVLRNTNMPAILVEGGFMDSYQDIVAMRDDSKLDAQGRAIATGAAEYFGLKKGSGKVEVSEPSKTVNNKNNKPVASTSKGYTSVVDYLEDKRMDSSFNNRKKLAVEYGVVNSAGQYKGTSAQNTQLLNKLLKGKKVSRPSAPSKVSHKRGDMKTTSIVDYLKSIKVDSSLSSRKKLAVQYGVVSKQSQFRGTTAQNTQLLNAMRKGSTSKSSKKQTHYLGNYVGRWVRARVNNVNYYNSQRWTSRSGVVNKGYGFIITGKAIKVGNGYQLPVKNSKGQRFYITASVEYVYID